MKRITAGVLVVAACGSTLLMGGTATAASPRTGLEINLINTNPFRVQLPTDGRPAKVEINVAINRGTASRVEVTLKPVGFGSRGVEPKEARTFDRGNRPVFVAFFNKNDKPGKWLATAVAFDRFGNRASDSYAFDVVGTKPAKQKVNTEIRDFEVSRDVVRKGKSISFRGVLASQERRFKGIADQEVGIYFRTGPRRAWQLVTETETSRFGRFSAKVRAVKSGEFRAVFEGNDEANRAESDAVRVRVKRGHGFGGGFGR